MNTAVSSPHALGPFGPQPPLGELCRRAAALHEAVLNQELTAMQLAAQRLCAFARTYRLGPIAWHAAAICSLCGENPDALDRLVQLLDGLELAVETTITTHRNPT